MLESLSGADTEREDQSHDEGASEDDGDGAGVVHPYGDAGTGVGGGAVPHGAYADVGVGVHR